MKKTEKDSTISWTPVESKDNKKAPEEAEEEPLEDNSEGEEAETVKEFPEENSEAEEAETVKELPEENSEAEEADTVKELLEENSEAEEADSVKELPEENSEAEEADSVEKTEAEVNTEALTPEEPEDSKATRGIKYFLFKNPLSSLELF